MSFAADGSPDMRSVDAGGGLDTGVADASDCTPGVAVTDRQVCNPDDLEFLYTVDDCGTFLEPTTRCFGEKACEERVPGEAACLCRPTGALTCRASDSRYPQSLYDDTYVTVERECTDAGGLDPADIIDTCAFGSVCYIDDYDEDPTHVQRNGGVAFCARSMTDESSPYYNHGANRSSQEFMRYPTSLEVDCRSRVFAQAASDANGGTGSAPADPNNIDPSADPNAFPAGSIMNCKEPTRLDEFPWPVAYGEGPVFGDFNDGQSTWYGAEFDPESRELFTLVNWGDSSVSNTGTIVAWNVDTKDRRVVSGILPNRVSGDETFGSGYESPNSFVVEASGTQPLTDADVLRLASDGNLYTSSPHDIVRIDPNTGARTLVWQRQDEALTGDISATYGQCFRPDRLGIRDGLQMEFTSFEVGPDMQFYKAFRDGRGGNGIAEISADGGTCEVIFRWNDSGDPDPSGGGIGVAPAPDIGTGPDLQGFQLRGMLHHDEKLYVLLTPPQWLVEFDLVTSTWRRVDDPDVSSALGYTSMSWDDSRNVLWVSGNVSQTFGGSVVDPVTGQNELIISDMRDGTYAEPILRSVYPGGGSGANTGGGVTSNRHFTHTAGVINDPLNRDIAYGVNTVGALIKLELSTFNSYVHSWGQHGEDL
ncbi:MAG: hypothetical protein AAF938_03450 [Myxococcota bacterium]